MTFQYDPFEHFLMRRRYRQDDIAAFQNGPHNPHKNDEYEQFLRLGKDRGYGANCGRRLCARRLTLTQPHCNLRDVVVQC